MQQGIFSTLSCSTLCFLASTFKLCNNIYIQMLTVIFHPGKRRCHLKVPCVMQSRDLTRGLACGVGMDFNCLKRDHFKKRNSLATRAHPPEVKGHFCSLEVAFGREGRVLLLPFLVPTFGNILGRVKSFTEGLRQLLEHVQGGIQHQESCSHGWLFTDMGKFILPLKIHAVPQHWHPCPGFPVSVITLSLFSFSGAGVYKQFQDKIAALWLQPRKLFWYLASCQHISNPGVLRPWFSCWNLCSYQALGGLNTQKITPCWAGMCLLIFWSTLDQRRLDHGFVLSCYSDRIQM